MGSGRRIKDRLERPVDASGYLRNRPKLVPLVFKTDHSPKQSTRRKRPMVALRRLGTLSGGFVMAPAFGMSSARSEADHVPCSVIATTEKASVYPALSPRASTIFLPMPCDVGAIAMTVEGLVANR